MHRAGLRGSGGQQTIVRAVLHKAQRRNQHAALQVVTHQLSGADGHTQTGDGRLQAEIEVLVLLRTGGLRQHRAADL